MNKTRLLPVFIVILSIAGVLAFTGKRTSPIYLYTQCVRTGKCTLKDSTRQYTPVSPGTPGAFPILGNMGNPDGLGTCDTLYVLLTD